MTISIIFPTCGLRFSLFCSKDNKIVFPQLEMHEDAEDVVDDGETHRYGGGDSLYDTDTRLSGFALLRKQFWALFIKRFHHTRRNRKAFLSQVKYKHLFFRVLVDLMNI